MTGILPDTKTVLDTNVLASGFVRANPVGAPARILDAWRERRFTMITSEHILGELATTLDTPYFSRRLPPEEIVENLVLLRAQTQSTIITVTVTGVATHPEDDLVLATAVSANAEYLVTGDAQLLRLGQYQDVTILSPRAFLDLLNGEQAEGDLR